jgi:hypothetical protein
MSVQLVKNFGHEPRVAPVDDGVYEVQLVTITEPKMYPGFQGGPEVEKCRFVFETTKAQDPAYVGKELSMMVNINATGERSWLYKITKAITGKNPVDLGEFDLYDLCYQKCRVQVVVQTSSDGVDEYANIKDVMPLRKTTTGPAPVSTTPPAPTSINRNAKREAAQPAARANRTVGKSEDTQETEVQNGVAVEDVDEQWFEN